MNDIQSTQWPAFPSSTVFLFLSISVTSPGFPVLFFLLVYISVDAGFAHGISQGDLISVLILFSAVVPPSHAGVSAAAKLTQLCTRKRVVFTSREACSSFGISSRAGSLDYIDFRSIVRRAFAFQCRTPATLLERTSL